MVIYIPVNQNLPSAGVTKYTRYKMTKPKLVYDTIDVSVAYIPLDKLLIQIKEWIAEYGKETCLDFREEYGNCQGKLEFQRPETETEIFFRQKAVKKQKERRKEQYEKLKEEFGD